MTFTAWLGAAAAAATLTSLASCSPRHDTPVEPSDIIADLPGCFIAADTASADGEAGVQVAVSDTILRLWRGGVLTADTLPSPLDGNFTYTSAQPLVDALYRLEAATPAGAYSGATPWRSYLVPLPADTVAALLAANLSGNVLRPTETRRYAWPVVNDDPIWLLAAAETATASGDRGAHRRLRQFALSLAGRDAPISWNPRLGLFCGVPSYIAASRGLPAWMEPTDIFECITLADNVARLSAAGTLRALDSYNSLTAADYLPVSPDSLRRNVNTLMWLPNLGRYSALLYGSPAFPVQLPASDNAAMALAVLGGVASRAMTETAVRRTPVTADGIGGFTPAWTDTVTQLPPSPLLRQAYWTAVCARSGNETAYSAAVSALLLRRLRLLDRGPAAGNADRAVTALIVRGLLGMRFTPSGVAFAPFVPENLPGEKVIRGLRYRRARLDIRLSGTGNAISTFTIDSTASEPFIPADLEGDHTLTITLAGASAVRGDANVQETDPPALPPPPGVEWDRNRNATLIPAAAVEESRGDSRFLVYLNGTLTEEIYRDTYTLYDARATTTVLFSPVSPDNAVGFAGRPYTYIPPGQRIVIAATTFAKGGTRIVSDKTAAARLVELNRYRNSNATLEVEITRPGTYMVDVRYINGLGIVNKQRRTVLRRLEVNSRPAGTLVFPQLSAAWWDKDLGEHWQELAARTNAIPVRLEKGRNTIAIRYYQPSPVYLDPAHNTVLIESINLTYIPDSNRLP